MSPQNPLGEYLRARRELTRPEEHGLPIGRRRVPGLRREELAMLAGISAEYYVRLERGRDRNPSAGVVDALARVLGLDPESKSYLVSLVVPAGRPDRSPKHDRVNPTIMQLLRASPTVPSFILGRFMDVLAHNRAAEVLHGRSLHGNIVRQIFLDPSSRETYPDWDDVAAETVASLRASAAGFDNDPNLTGLVGELSLKSPEFVRLWARHDVRAKTSGVKRIISPAVGEVSVRWESLSVNSAPGQLLVAYFTEPGSASERAMERVAEIAVNQDAARRWDVVDR